MMKCYSSS